MQVKRSGQTSQFAMQSTHKESAMAMLPLSQTHAVSPVFETNPAAVSHVRQPLRVFCTQRAVLRSRYPDSQREPFLIRARK